MSEVVRGDRARGRARVLPLVAGVSAWCLVVAIAPSAVAAPSRTVAPQTVVVAAAGPSAEPVTGATKGARGREGDPVTVTLRGSDPDSAPAQLTYSAAPESGTAEVNNDQLTYTPADGVFGTQTFDYTVTDEQGGTATSTVTISIGHDPAPVAGNASATTRGSTDRPGDPVTIPVTISDNETAALRYAVSDPAHGSATIGAPSAPGGSATIIYTPGIGFAETEVFTWSATDSHGEVGTGTITVTVVANRAPVGSAQQRTVRAGGSFTLQLTASDPDGDPVSFARTTDPQRGVATVTSAGVLTYTADPAASGPDSVGITVTDVRGAATTFAVTITVDPNSPPTAPTLTGTTFSSTQRTGLPVPVVLASSDPEGDPLSYALGAVSGGTATLDQSGATKRVIFTPAIGFVGPAVVNYTVTDGYGPAVAGTIDVTVLANTVPVVTPKNAQVKGSTGRAGDIAQLDLTGVDPDVPDRTLRYELLDQPLPTEGTVGLSGSQLSFTPAARYSGTVVLRYRATDTVGDFATATATIVVSPNEAPTTPNVAKQTQGSTGKPGDPVTIALPGSDVDGIASYAFSTPAKGTAVRAPDCGPAPAVCNSVVYTPSAANTGGPDTFTYTATDARGATSNGTVTITVIANDKPVGTTNSGSTIFGRPVKIYLEATDRQGDALSFTAASPATDASLTYGVEDPNDPERKRPYVLYTPNPAPSLGRFEAGTDTFAYKVQDARGASSTKSITVRVAPNSAPVPTPVAVTTRGGSGDVSGLTKEFELSATDPDAREDDGPLTFALVGQPENGTATLLPSGTTIAYTPEPGFVGTETITYRVTDHVVVGGRERPDLEATTTATAKVTVTANNAPPAAPVMAVTGASTVGAGLPVVVRLASVDPDGDAVSFGVGTVSEEFGVISGINGAQFTFTPVQGFSGAVLVPYTVTDVLGATTTGIVVIDVKENHAPVAKPASASTRGGTTVAGSTVSIPLAGNISDPDTSLFRDRLTVTLTAPPAYGTVTVSGTTLTYTPRTGYVGTNVIGYQVSDGRGGSATSTVAVNVTPNRAPAIAAQTRRIPAGGSVVVNLTGTDPDRDAMTFSASAPRGTVSVVAGTGRLLYTAPQGFAGIVKVPTTVRDLYGATATSTVTYTMYGPSKFAEVLVPANPVSTVAPRFGVTVTSVLGTVSGGVVTVKADGAVIGTARVAWNGTATITSRIKLTKGRHAIAVSFAGTATTSSAPTVHTSLVFR